MLSPDQTVAREVTSATFDAPGRPLTRAAAESLVKSLLRFGFAVRPSIALVHETFTQLSRLTPRGLGRAPRPVFVFMATREAVRTILLMGFEIESRGLARATAVYNSACALLRERSK